MGRRVSLVLSAFTLLLGCDRGDGGSDPEDGQSGGKADDARICPDVPPTYADPGEGASGPARRAALQDYVDALMLAKTCELEDVFDAEGLAGVVPLEDAYRIEVGANGCLDEDLGSDGKHDQLVTHVEAVVQFVTTFHDDMDGIPNGLFNRVHVCREDDYDDDLKLTLEDRVLGVGVSYSTLGIGSAPQDGEKVRAWWRDGKQIDHRDDVKAWNDEFIIDGTDDLWTVLDPVGDARMSLRDSMAEAAIKLAGELEALDDAREANEKQIAAVIRDNVSGSSGHRNVRACALGYIEGRSNEQLALLVSGWRAGLMRPGVWNALAETVVAGSQPATSIAGRAAAQECGTADLGNIELPNIDVRLFLGDWVDSLDVYLTTLAGERDYADGSPSCWFTVEGEDVVVSADKAVRTAALDYLLYQDEVDCAAVAIEDDEPDEPVDDPDDPKPDPDEPDPDEPDPDEPDPDRPPGDPDPDDPEPDPEDPPKDPDDPDDPEPDPGDPEPDPDDPAPEPEDQSDDNPWDDEDPDEPDGPEYDPYDEDDGDDGDDPWADPDDGNTTEDPMEDAEDKEEGGGCSIGDRPHEGAVLALGLLLLGLRRRRGA